MLDARLEILELMLTISMSLDWVSMGVDWLGLRLHGVRTGWDRDTRVRTGWD